MATTIDPNLLLHRDTGPRTGGLKHAPENSNGTAGMDKSQTQSSPVEAQVDVQQANRLIQMESVKDTGNIQSREQAEGVLARLRGLFDQNPESALASFRTPAPAMLSSLLNPP